MTPKFLWRLYQQLTILSNCIKSISKDYCRNKMTNEGFFALRDWMPEIFLNLTLNISYSHFYLCDCSIDNDRFIFNLGKSCSILCSIKWLTWHRSTRETTQTIKEIPPAILYTHELARMCIDKIQLLNAGKQKQLKVQINKCRHCY